MLLASALCLTLNLAPMGDPTPVTVVGTVELTPGAAMASARAAAADEFAWELERRGRAILERTQPGWLPDFVAEAQVRRWLRNVRPEAGLRVVDAETRAHDHGDFLSYQTSLAVVQDERWTGVALGQLRGTIRESARRFVFTCGGAVGLWSLLALLYAWFDRISRGYMSWRLRILFGGMGLVLPGIALVLV